MKVKASVKPQKKKSNVPLAVKTGIPIILRKML